jgi:hypothetical protein
MRPVHSLILAPLLLLAACGDEGQQARSPTDSELRDGTAGRSAASGTNASGSRDTASSDGPNFRPGQPTNRPPQPPALPEPGPETTGSVIRPATPSAGQPAAPAATAPAPDRIAPAITGRTFAASGSWIQFSSDNRFTLRDTAAEREVRGRYALEGDRITFADPQGDTRGLNFPFTCRMMTPTPQTFEIEGSDAGCATLSGKRFESQG